MSLFGISSSSNQLALGATGANGTAGQAGIGGGMLQAAFPGAQMAQPGDGGSIIKKMLVGGIAGAGMGAGYGLLAGMVSFLPHITIPMGALIGAAAGAALGLIKGLLDKRNANLAMQRQINAQPPIALPRPLAGRTYAMGSSGASVKWTQRALKKVGMYAGKVSGRLDERTAVAIRKYELLKGALPTGQSSPDLRAALSQDIKLSRQFS